MKANYIITGRNVPVTTARLPLDTRNKLLALSMFKNRTKSEIIIESLELYYAREESGMDSYTLGESVFGRYGSGDSDRATTYKQRIKEKTLAKLNSY